VRIEEAIVTAVNAASPTIAPIYANTLPPRPTYPAITYARVSTTQPTILDGVDTLTDVRIQFDIWGESVSSVKDAADALRTLLNGTRGAFGGMTVQYIKFDDENDFADIDGDLESRRVSMDFVFTLHE
jgi:hypothetical protein